jgi:hypothetical protein
VFYLSHDDVFIIKTVQTDEHHFLRKLLPGYHLVRRARVCVRACVCVCVCVCVCMCGC